MLLLRLLLIAGTLLALGSCLGGNQKERVQRFLELGDSYHDKGQYNEASIMYRKALQQDRRSPEAWYKLALNAMKEQKYDLAGQALRRVVELDPDNLDAFRYLAEFHLASLEAPLPLQPRLLLENLMRIIEKAEVRHPEAFEVLYVKGRVLRYQGEIDNAIRMLRRAQEANPSDFGVNFALVTMLMEQEQYQEAEVLARALLEQEEPDSKAFDLMYMLRIRQGDYDEARELLEEKCERYPEVAKNWILLADFYRGTGRQKKMEDTLHYLLDRPDTFPTGHHTVGVYYLLSKQPEIALQYFSDGLAANPEQAALYRQGLIRAHLAQGKIEDAARELDALLDVDPENPAAVGLRGMIALQSNDPERLPDAIADLERAVSRAPESYLFRYYLARAHLAAGDRMSAELQLREALMLNEDFLPARHSLLEVHLANGEFGEAEVAARAILDERPLDRASRLGLCSALIGLGEHERARGQINLLREQKVDPALIAFHMGRIELAEGNHTAAEREFRAALAANPQHAPAARALFELQMDRKKFDDAERLIKSQMNEASAPDDLQVLLARVAVSRGEMGRAEGILNQVLSANPEHPTANLHLGNVLMMNGRTSEAGAHFRRVIDGGGKDPRAFFGYGTVLLTEGRYAEAQEALQQAVDLAPDYAEALNNLAWALAEGGGDLDLALTYAQRAVARQPENPDFSDTLAYVYLKKNLNRDAVKVLEKLVRQHPERGMFRYHLGLAYYQEGNVDDARRELQAAQTSQMSPDTRQAVARLLSEIEG